jgi:hypothetical protein
VPGTIAELHISGIRRTVYEEPVLTVIERIHQLDEIAEDAIRNERELLIASGGIECVQHTVVPTDVDHRLAVAVFRQKREVR